MAQGSQPNHHVTGKKDSVKITRGSFAESSGNYGQPPRPKQDDKKDGKSLVDWLKDNWSNPMLSPGELEKQRETSNKQNKRPLKEQILKKYN